MCMCVKRETEHKKQLVEEGVWLCLSMTHKFFPDTNTHTPVSRAHLEVNSCLQHYVLARLRHARAHTNTRQLSFRTTGQSGHRRRAVLTLSVAN